MAALSVRMLAVMAWLAAGSAVRADELEARLLHDGGHAAAWLQPAIAGALAGHAVDERAVAAGYEWGGRLPLDPVAALAWYRRAAQHGSLQALVDVGASLETGASAANLADAVALYRSAAMQGSAAAELRLGMAFEWGHGVERDAGAAEAHYRRAMAAGSPLAGVFLSLLPAHAAGAKQAPSPANHDMS